MTNKYNREMSVKNILARLRRTAKRYARKRHLHAEDVDDLIQEGYLAIYESVPEYKDGSFSKHISLAAKRAIDNASISLLRNRFSDRKEMKRPIRSPARLQDLVFCTRFAPAHENIQYVDEERKLLGGLTPRGRSVFTMKVVDEFTHKEIGGKLGISEGTSKWHHHTALKELQEIFVDQDGQQRDE